MFTAVAGLIIWMSAGGLAVRWASRKYGRPPEVATADLVFSAAIWPLFLVVVGNRGGWNF